MAFVEKILAGSERVYRCLVKVQPKEFRAEHESEMVQNFRDLCREQLDRASATRVLGLWSHTVLDLAASAAIEHLRRRKPMNTLDQDLRWDLRYGVQMFCKHSLWLLKYTSLAFIGGAIAIVLAAWLWSGVRIWQKGKAVQQSWVQMTGKTPEAYFQAALQRFPKSGMNETARRLEELTTRLGIFNPMPNRYYDGKQKGATGPFGTVDVPAHVLSQLRKPSDDLDAAPGELQRYLQTHRADLDALYSLIQRNDIPRWETDVAQLVRAPAPGLLYHRQLQGLIALDILDRTRKRQNLLAVQALEASWRVSQSLRERPELISHMVATSMLKLQMEVMRKMESVPGEWQARLAVKTWQESFLRTMEFDALVMSQYVADPSNLGVPRWFHPFYGPLGKPVRRLAKLEILEVAQETLSAVRTSDFCRGGPDREFERLENSRSSWNLGTRFGITNYLRAWKTSVQTLAQMELTRKVLQVKEARRYARDSKWPDRLGEMESVLCPEARWVHEVAPSGTIQIQCRNLPEWLKAEFPQSMPLKYSLPPAS
jgi:hypothetical protein